MKFDAQTYRLTDKGRLGSIALVTGIIGLGLSCIGWATDTRQFYFSYLTAFFFWLSIGLGGLFFVMLHHLVDAKWSIVIRRIAENLAMVVPVFIVLFIPILFGMKEIFEWMNPEIVGADHLLMGKSGYLNFSFFLIRIFGYFIIWTALALLLRNISLKQDKSPHFDQIKRMRLISAPGMIVFALTLTFASFDLLMSLDAHWYSTIFGVYVFSGAFLAMLAFTTLLIITLQRHGVLTEAITGEHYHDLGKLMFAFIIFWGYMAFSQYFLIWYANIPEETIWFLHRWEGSWRTITLLLVFGHFVLPFLILFPQTIKRNKSVMTVVTIWILVMHWLDIYWIVMPTLHHHGFHFSWLDVSTVGGIGGIFVFLLWKFLAANPMVPLGDPGLAKSLHTIS